MVGEATQQTVDEILDAGVELLNRDVDDTYRFVGAHAEQIENPADYQPRVATAMVLGPEVAPQEQLEQYASRGRAFVRRWLAKIEPELRKGLCTDHDVRPELKDLEPDSKNLLTAVFKEVLPLLVVAIPGGIVGALAAVAAGIAALLIMSGIEQFCKSGSEAIK